jgi:nicotinate-nucleotide adenylyltransferase
LLDDQGFSKVLLIPSGVPPFKNNISHTIKHRLHMCELVVTKLPTLQIEDYEAKSKDPSYTYETLKYLSDKYPENNYFWTIGYDNLFHIETWYKGVELLKEFGIVVINRGGYDLKLAQFKQEELTKSYKTNFINITIPNIEISSTDIRTRVVNNQSIVGYTLESIIEYIDQNNLYQEV